MAAGITPDVYVPFDTTSMGKETVKLYMKGTLSNFIYTYYIQRKQDFGGYKKPNELADAFHANENEWEALKAFAARDTVDLNKINAKDKADILKRMPGLVARQMWRRGLPSWREAAKRRARERPTPLGQLIDEVSCVPGSPAWAPRQR